jgi:DNA repair ATPase RecN
MKKWIYATCLAMLLSLPAASQSFEVQQLLLNIEKLSQFRKILQNMYDGYKVLHQGYTAIKDISEGNFTLHKTFLDALLEVSPAVRKYKRISDIISYQLRLVTEYKSAFTEFKEGGSFTPEEVEYLGKVYANLLKKSGESLEELLLVITSGSLRMSDEERLAAIDRIYQAVEERFSFLKSFNSDTALLSLHRKSEKIDIELSKKVFGF